MVRFAKKGWGGVLLLRCRYSSAVHSETRCGRPGKTPVNVLKNSFTGPIATGLSLIAIVVGGPDYAYGEGHSKRTMAGTISAWP